MNYLPEYIRKAYPVPPENPDYEMMARMCHEALENHPEDRDYLLAYEAVYLGYCGKHKEAVEHCRKYLPGIKVADCAKDLKRTLVYNLDQSGAPRAALTELEEQLSASEN